MRVEVRGLIVDAGRVAVVDWVRNGERRLSLPGGRVERWESVTDALIREVREELGVEIEPGPFVAAFETVARYKIQDLNLVFAARLRDPDEVAKLRLVDPAGLAVPVFPPALSRLASAIAGDGAQAPWLGNIWEPHLVR